MTGSVTDVDKFWEYQGDSVLVRKAEPPSERIFTIVRVVDAQQSLRLVHRLGPGHKPDWALTPKLWEAITPARAEVVKDGIKWELTVR